VHTPAGFTPSHVLPALLPGTALAFAYSDTKLLVGGDEQAPAIPTLAELERAQVDGVRHYLGELQGVPCVAIVLPHPFEAPAGLRPAGLRSLFFRLPESIVAIGARAFQVVEWDRTHRFCGRCGTPTRDKPGERAKACPACGYVAYPRVSPAMMALVTRGREILLARAHRFPPAMYSALAGFVEPGETLEQCLAREVEEEVGIRVSRIRYFASQPWPFPHSLMIAFVCDWESGEIHPRAGEIEAAHWFDVLQLPKLPSRISIARRLIDAVVGEMRTGLA